MRADSSSSVTRAIIAIVVAATLVSTVSAVWTCPSERGPFCCGKYARLRESPTVLIGVECIDAPRNDNCIDGRAVRCCKAMKPESPRDPKSPPDPSANYYCDSRAVGYSQG
ncbi:hypothetical protein RJZ90_000081 [Blastomyces dermatitidis]